MKRGATIRLLNFASIFLLSVPLSAAAAGLEITEISYDPPGADAGHEWIEITNQEKSPLSVAGYKFFEANTNHGIAAVVGTTSLAAGESAIIADNTTDFLADFPTYSGALFKSSFSLSNTGESLSLKDAKLQVVDSVSYTKSEGAAGDGNTLHRATEGLVAGAPDPGVYTDSPPAPIAKASAEVPADTVPPALLAKSDKLPPAPASSQGATRVPAATASVTAATPDSDISPLWLYGLGACAIVLLGAGATLFLRVSKRSLETAPSAEEFDIED